MNDSTGAFFVTAQRLQSTLFNRGFDRLVVDLIEIDEHAAFEIRLLPKGHVHKTESAIVHKLRLERRTNFSISFPSRPTKSSSPSSGHLQVKNSARALALSQSSGA